MKYILVTGGVISGIGKGVIASSIGTILKHHGLKVTSIKIDPYINIDAGTFSPYEHGEVYVLDDGGEVDLDLGNYERFLDITLKRDNNITTGKIYSSVIAKERKGDYLGKTVQVVPHITDAIQEWVEKVAHQPVNDENICPEVCIIELGGTIGDIEGMPFVEAFRQFQFRAKRENMCVVHVSLVPQPSSTREHKTKPTQSSVRELRGLGLSPDFIVCRSEVAINADVKNKISNFCHVPPDYVICLHDANNIYEVPMMLEEQNTSVLLNERLQMNLPAVKPRNFMKKWKNLVARQQFLRHTVKIALVGKYIQLEDAYASVIKALEHSATMCNRKLILKCIDAEDLEENAKVHKSVKYFEAWQNVCKANGIVVPGGFGMRGMEGKIAVCQWARVNGVPFLGICLGLQAAVIEFARNKLNWRDACSQEMSPEGARHVVIEMPEHNPGDLGGTMRLGRRQTVFKGESKIRRLYGNPDYIEERHRHRYEVNPSYADEFRKAGMRFVGEDSSGQRMEIMELDDHVYYVACQYHPEYLSRPLKPSPPFIGLLLASCKKLDTYFARGCRASPLDTPETSDDDELHVNALSLGETASSSSLSKSPTPSAASQEEVTLTK